MINLLNEEEMKSRFVIFILVWAVVIPAMASGVIMLLWNLLMPALLGSAVIGFWQAAGLFLLCQVLSGGFAVGLFLLAVGVHTIFHHHNHVAMKRWKSMTDEQRKEILTRRMSRFGYKEHLDGAADKQTDGHGGNE